MWGKNDAKHTCREEKVDLRGRLKIVASISFVRNEPNRIRSGSGRAREAKPPTVPMNSTADPFSDFPWKKTFVLLFELRYPTSLREVRGLLQKPATLALCMQAKHHSYLYLLGYYFYLWTFLRWVCHRKWSPNPPLSQWADLEAAPLRRANCGLPWPPCLCRRELQQLLSPALCRQLSILWQHGNALWLYAFLSDLAGTGGSV